MKSRLDTTLDLLHAASDAALATFSVKLAGYPFASQVPFAPDAQHRPVVLISALAEHSRNLTANPRASLLVSTTLAEGEIARVTLTGELHPVEPEPALMARYLRYHPAAERFLQSGDFGFRYFIASQIYVVGGFGQAGWLEADRLSRVPSIDYALERTLIESATATLRPDIRLLGIDACGIDVMKDKHRLRLGFAETFADEASLRSATAALVATLNTEE